MKRMLLGNEAAARERLERIRATPYTFDEGLALAGLGDHAGAVEAFARARFADIEMAVSYWPTVCTRYLFGRVWRSFGDPSVHAGMLERIEKSWVR